MSTDLTAAKFMEDPLPALRRWSVMLRESIDSGDLDHAEDLAGEIDRLVAALEERP